MLRILSTLLLGLVAAAPVAVGSERAAQAMAQCEKNVERHVGIFHVDATRLDRTASCREFVRKLEAGLGFEHAWEGVLGEIREADLHWAPKGARHAPRARYRLPYVAWMPRLCSQGPGVGVTDPDATHTSLEQLHAYDFLMPVGTLVLAAREGTVKSVWDATPDGLAAEKDAGNFVRVLHADGTYATYLHLAPGGALVKRGDAVKRAQPIGRSGDTGLSRTPHLHFMVQRRTSDNQERAIPINFTMRGRPSFKPEVGHHHGVMPNSKLQLRVSVAGPAPRKLAYGALADVRVERIHADGRVEDLSRSERVRYETMTVWNLFSPAPGQIRAEPSPGTDVGYIQRTMPALNQGEGRLHVYHGVPRDPDFGFASVSFQIQR